MEKYRKREQTGKIKKEEKTKYEKTETIELWKERGKKIRNEEMRNVNKD